MRAAVEEAEVEPIELEMMETSLNQMTVRKMSLMEKGKKLKAVGTIRLAVTQMFRKEEVEMTLMMAVERCLSEKEPAGNCFVAGIGTTLLEAEMPQWGESFLMA